MSHEDDTEEVVLSRWGKLKQWFEIAMATRKLYLFVMSMLLATGGSVVVGQATDTRPIRDAAVALGILDEPVLTPQQVAKSDALSALATDIVRLEDMLRVMGQHSHPPVDVHHDHEVQSHPHPYAPINHAHEASGGSTVDAVHTHPPPESQMSPTVKDEIEATMVRHIADDH